MTPVVADFCKSVGFRFTRSLVATALIATRLVVGFLMATTSPWRQAGQEKTPSRFWRLFSPTGSNCWAHTLHLNWRQFLRCLMRIEPNWMRRHLLFSCCHKYYPTNTRKTSNTQAIQVLKVIQVWLAHLWVNFQVLYSVTCIWPLLPSLQSRFGCERCSEIPGWGWMRHKS